MDYNEEDMFQVQTDMFGDQTQFPPPSLSAPLSPNPIDKQNSIIQSFADDSTINIDLVRRRHNKANVATTPLVLPPPPPPRRDYANNVTDLGAMNLRPDDLLVYGTNAFKRPVEDFIQTANVEIWELNRDVIRFKSNSTLRSDDNLFAQLFNTKKPTHHMSKQPPTDGAPLQLFNATQKVDLERVVAVLGFCGTLYFAFVVISKRYQLSVKVGIGSFLTKRLDKNRPPTAEAFTGTPANFYPLWILCTPEVFSEVPLFVALMQTGRMDVARMDMIMGYNAPAAREPVDNDEVVAVDGANELSDDNEASQGDNSDQEPAMPDVVPSTAPVTNSSGHKKRRGKREADKHKRVFVAPSRPSSADLLLSRPVYADTRDAYAVRNGTVLLGTRLTYAAAHNAPVEIDWVWTCCTDNGVSEFRVDMGTIWQPGDVKCLWQTIVRDMTESRHDVFFSSTLGLATAIAPRLGIDTQTFDCPDRRPFIEAFPGCCVSVHEVGMWRSGYVHIVTCFTPMTFSTAKGRIDIGGVTPVKRLRRLTREWYLSETVVPRSIYPRITVVLFFRWLTGYLLSEWGKDGHGIFSQTELPCVELFPDPIVQ
jgi:hypothetical protein